MSIEPATRPSVKIVNSAIKFKPVVKKRALVGVKELHQDIEPKLDILGIRASGLVSIADQYDVVKVGEDTVCEIQDSMKVPSEEVMVQTQQNQQIPEEIYSSPDISQFNFEPKNQYYTLDETLEKLEVDDPESLLPVLLSPVEPIQEEITLEKQTMSPTSYADKEIGTKEEYVETIQEEVPLQSRNKHLQKNRTETISSIDLEQYPKEASIGKLFAQPGVVFTQQVQIESKKKNDTESINESLEEVEQKPTNKIFYEQEHHLVEYEALTQEYYKTTANKKALTSREKFMQPMPHIKTKNKISEMLRYQHPIFTPAIAELNNSEKERLKKRLAQFEKLRQIINQYEDKCLIYIQDFMGTVLHVPPSDIPFEEVHKFIEFIKSESMPDPKLGLDEVILQSLNYDVHTMREQNAKTKQVVPEFSRPLKR